MAQPTSSRLQQVIDEHTPQWMSMPGVVAVGSGQSCIKIYFANDSAMKTTSIPDTVEGIIVVKTVSGTFEAQS